MSERELASFALKFRMYTLIYFLLFFAGASGPLDQYVSSPSSERTKAILNIVEAIPRQTPADRERKQNLIKREGFRRDALANVTKVLKGVSDPPTESEIGDYYDDTFAKTLYSPPGPGTPESINGSNLEMLLDAHGRVLI